MQPVIRLGKSDRVENATSH